MPSDSHNSTMAKATGLIFSLFNVASRVAMIQCIDVSIYFLLCITLQWYIVWCMMKFKHWCMLFFKENKWLFFVEKQPQVRKTNCDTAIYRYSLTSCWYCDTVLKRYDAYIHTYIHIRAQTKLSGFECSFECSNIRTWFDNKSLLHNDVVEGGLLVVTGHAQGKLIRLQSHLSQLV